MTKAIRREHRPARAALIVIGAALGLLGASMFFARGHCWRDVFSRSEACQGLTDEARLSVATQGQ